LTDTHAHTHTHKHARTHTHTDARAHTHIVQGAGLLRGQSRHGDKYVGIPFKVIEKICMQTGDRGLALIGATTPAFKDRELKRVEKSCIQIQFGPVCACRHVCLYLRVHACACARVYVCVRTRVCVWLSGCEREGGGRHKRVCYLCACEFNNISNT
jgi:hypothetical protein